MFCRKLGKFTDLRFALIAGGKGFDDQFERLAQNPDIIIATPGRVLHHIEDLDSLFKCFLKLMKPHTYLCLTDLKKDAKMFDLQIHHHDHKMPHRGFVPEELCELLKKAGFIKTEIKPASDIIFTTHDGKEIISERFMIFAESP